MKPVHYIFAGLAVLVILVAGVGAAVLLTPYQFHGSEIAPARTAPEIVLPTVGGESFRLSEQQGKLVLIFFGYTRCPDVCPLTLSEFKQVKEALGERADQVEFVFITVDPERDTPELMAEHVARFDPEFVGLSGSAAELDPVWRAYGVYHEAVPMSAGYSMDHSAFTYLIDKAGNLRLTYGFGTPVEDLLADVRELLKEEP